MTVGGKGILEQMNISESAVVLDHFEYLCEDPEVNRIKLNLLVEDAKLPAP